jgi:hypothetical protein
MQRQWRFGFLAGATTLCMGVAACGGTSSTTTDAGAALDAATPDAETDASADAGTDSATKPACYTPTPAGAKESKQWQKVGPDDIGELSITAPADLGGGYIEVSVVAAHADVRPWLEITTGADNGAITAGSSAGNGAGFDVPARRYAFEAAPGQTYKIRTWQFFSAPPEAYPVSYTIEWKFTSLVDCYEPNDSAAEAKPIKMGDTIEAYAAAGHVTNGIDYDRFVDWYSFEVAAEAPAKVELLQAPGTSLRMGIRIFDAAGAKQLAEGGGTTGGELFDATTANPLAPGSYRIAVETKARASFEDTNDLASREEWKTPYRIRLTNTP